MSQKLKVSASELHERSQNPSFMPYLRYVRGPLDKVFSQAAEPAQATADTLTFASTPELLEKAKNAGGLIVLEKLVPQLPPSTDQVIFATPNMSAAMAVCLPLFDRKQERFGAGIHPTAQIHPSAQIGKNVVVGAFAVVGASANVGEGCLIGTHSIIEESAKIGQGTILHPHVFIGANCELGSQCEIHPQTSLGCDGFGFIQGQDDQRHKIPQIGKVVLEDFVEMGSCCTIDRATLGETRIGEGSKFDNHCHVAHNCKIGKHNVFAAGFMMAGSSEIGDNCTFGGRCVVTDHVKITSNCQFGGLSGIHNDVLQSGVYAGYPLQAFKDSMRTTAALTHLTEMRKQLARVMKQLKLNEE